MKKFQKQNRKQNFQEKLNIKGISELQILSEKEQSNIIGGLHQYEPKLYNEDHPNYVFPEDYPDNI